MLPRRRHVTRGVNSSGKTHVIVCRPVAAGELTSMLRCQALAARAPAKTDMLEGRTASPVLDTGHGATADLDAIRKSIRPSNDSVSILSSR